MLLLRPGPGRRHPWWQSDIQGGTQAEDLQGDDIHHPPSPHHPPTKGAPSTASTIQGGTLTRAIMEPNLSTTIVIQGGSGDQDDAQARDIQGYTVRRHPSHLHPSHCDPRPSELAPSIWSRRNSSSTEPLPSANINQPSGHHPPPPWRHIIHLSHRGGATIQANAEASSSQPLWRRHHPSHRRNIGSSEGGRR